MRDSGYIKKPYNTERKYAWVLVETLDFESEPKENKSYAMSHTYAIGSYSGTTTYIGEQVFTYKVGDFLSIQSQFSVIPKII